MTEILSKIRFLPLTIFAAALLLTVKVGNIWEGYEGLKQGTLSVADARAQQAQDTAQAPTPTAGAGQAAPGTMPEAAQTATLPSDQKSNLLADDPTLLTQAEIDLLQKLAERREALENQEKEMEMRTGLLNAAEARIDKKVEKLKELQATIEKLITVYDDQQNTKMQSLVKIYENMKPKDAARIFEELDMDTLLMVAERMKERKLAPIMAKMGPDKAREITVELSRLRQLPQSGSEVGG